MNIEVGTPERERFVAHIGWGETKRSEANEIES